MISRTHNFYWNHNRPASIKLLNRKIITFQSISLFRLPPTTLYFSLQYGALSTMHHAHQNDVVLQFTMHRALWQVHFYYALCTLRLRSVHFNYAPCTFHVVIVYFHYSQLTFVICISTTRNAPCTLVQCNSTMHRAPCYGALPQRQ